MVTYIPFQNYPKIKKIVFFLISGEMIYKNLKQIFIEISNVTNKYLYELENNYKEKKPNIHFKWVYYRNIQRLKELTNEINEINEVNDTNTFALFIKLYQSKEVLMQIVRLFLLCFVIYIFHFVFISRKIFDYV